MRNGIWEMWTGDGPGTKIGSPRSEVHGMMSRDLLFVFSSNLKLIDHGSNNPTSVDGEFRPPLVLNR